MTAVIEVDVDLMVKMRRRGESYRTIGEAVGVSHETARAILRELADSSLPASSYDLGRDKRKAQVEALTEWLNVHGPVPREAVTETFGYTNKEINTLVHEGLPGHLIMLSQRVPGPDMVEDDEALESIRRAWAKVQKASPEVPGLSHNVYDQVRDPDVDLSSARITSRYGWSDACARAGVPDGGKRREESTYKERWSHQNIVDAVAKYTRECVEAKARPTYLGYERWQRERSDAPSGSLVRVRMAKMGFRTWPEIVAKASHPIGE